MLTCRKIHPTFSTSSAYRSGVTFEHGFFSNVSFTMILCSTLNSELTFENVSLLRLQRWSHVCARKILESLVYDDFVYYTE